MTRQDVFRQRLHQVVETVFCGNVNRAAEEIGFPQPTLHKILHGKTFESKDSTLTSLADRLGVSSAWFRGEADHPGGSRQIPASLALLFLYHEQRQRRIRDSLARFTPRSKYGKLLRSAVDHGINWEEADSLWALCLEVAVSTGDFSPELAQVLRARLEYETARVQLAAEELRRSE